MKGVLFNLLEEVVADDRGLEAWDDVLDELGLDGAYTAVGTYPDEEFLAVVRALAPTRCPAAALAVVATSDAATGAGARSVTPGTLAVAAPDVHRDGPPDAEVLRWYGRRAIPLLAQRYPMFFLPHHDALDMLATVEAVIHCEVRKLDPTADVPTLGVHERARDGQRALGLVYRSPRRLCALAEGFVLGVGDHYAQPLQVTRPSCMHRGDPTCELVVVRG